MSLPYSDTIRLITTPSPRATNARRPGRPADPGIDAALVAAARAELADRGWRELTLERIAARAGVGRATAYRRHRSVHGVLLAMMGDIYEQVPVPDTGTLRGDLVALMREVIDVWSDPEQVRFLAALVAAQHDSPELAAAYLAQFTRRRAATGSIVRRGVRRGELRTAADGDLVLDLLAGIVAQRVLLRRRPMRRADAARVVDRLLDGFSPSGPRAAG